MNPLSINEIAIAVNGKVFGNENIIIKNIIIDSRTFSADKSTIFAAIKSLRNDGHNFIPELYKKGITNFIVSEIKKEFENFENANFIIVENTISALQKLGAYYRKNFTNSLVAITGSNGKTVVKEWIFQLLHENKNITRSPKSFNSQIGVPLSLMLLDNKFDLAIIEAGISFTGEMELLEKIIYPEIGIFTNIGNAHQENFENIEKKIREKIKLFKNSKLIIYNSDIKKTDEIIRNEYSQTKELFTWGKNKNASLKVLNINRKNNFTEIISLHNEKEISIKIPFTDTASVENSINCLAFLISSGNFSSQILEKFSWLSPVEMRLELKQGINNCTLINDFYNSDLSSLKIATDFLNTQNQHFRKTIILSDIPQSGTIEEELYKEISEIITKSGVTRIIGVGEKISFHKNYFKNIHQKTFYNSTEEFLNNFKTTDFLEETILIKGSRKFEMERISAQLIQKKHRTVMEINLNAIIHNLNYYKSIIKKETKIMIMVKAFSYGSGSFEIANLLQEQGVDYLGVAFADEGVKLRKAGISVPIIVMNPEIEGFANIIDFNLEPEIYSFGILREFIKSAEKNFSVQIPIHLKIDTGMKRLGFCDYEIDDLIFEIKKSDKIKIKSIFSHLAATDEEIHDDFTKYQLEKFKTISEKIISQFDYPIIRHSLNSSGIERFPEAQFEMVRLGIGLYGFSPKNGNKLMNVSTLRSKISQIKNVKTGETVGYSRKGKSEKDTKIAVIPIGYADGFNRALSNGKGKVLINGKFAPIIGNVCMDMCMADLQNIEAAENDDVIIFGDEFPASEISKILNTIPYEIITGISERVKRIYYRE